MSEQLSTGNTVNICWHGTDETAAMKILKEGFEPYTYFAAHIEDALAFGGPFVFHVIFNEPAPHWQFRPAERIGQERIKTLTQFWSRTIYGSPSFTRTEATLATLLPTPKMRKG